MEGVKVMTHVEEFEEYLKKAEQGDADAQHRLGLMYANGRGVAKDYEKAAEWYLKAALQGYADARDALENILSMVSQRC
jgi:uncharacterized protein